MATYWLLIFFTSGLVITECSNLQIDENHTKVSYIKSYICYPTNYKKLCLL